MKKKLKPSWLFLCAFSLVAVVHADEPKLSASTTKKCDCRTAHWILEPGISYFRPQADGLRDIYGSNWIAYHFSLGYAPSRLWNLLLKGEFMENRGKTVGLREQTTLRIMPLTLYVNWVFYSTRTLRFYVGAGPQYAYVKMRTHSKVLRGHESKQGFGGAGILGCVKELNEWFAFDLFASYSYVKIAGSSYGNIESMNRTYGGLTAGIGFRCRW